MSAPIYPSTHAPLDVPDIVKVYVAVVPTALEPRGMVHEYPVYHCELNMSC